MRPSVQAGGATPGYAAALAVVAVATACIVTCRSLSAVWARHAPPKPVACADGIEVIDPGQGADGARIGCLADLQAAGCGHVRPGDRVILDASPRKAGSPGACRVEPDGMRAAWMVAWRLPLDINRRSEADLAQVPGISPRLAARIVKHREQHGPFADMQALRAVPGLGPKRQESLRPWLRVGAMDASGLAAARPVL